MPSVTMPKPAGDVDKLPKWARRHIQTLEMRLGEAIEELGRGPEDSNVFARPYSDLKRQPLGRDVDVGFYLPPHHGREDYFKVMLNYDRPSRTPALEIHASYTDRELVVKPRSSNIVELFIVGRL